MRPVKSNGMATSYIAIHEMLDGEAVDWLEHVGNEQYHTGE